MYNHDQPKWDYWLWEDLGDGRRLSIYHDRIFRQWDIRDEKYNLDLEKWCKKYIWTAEEAALISFMRDPDKILRSKTNFQNLSLPEGAVTDESDRDNLVLRVIITKLIKLIKKAQEGGDLPVRVFRPGHYIDWAKLVGVDIPPDVEWGVERWRRLEAQLTERAGDTELADVKDEDIAMTSQQKRVINNIKKILLAILVESGLIKRDPDLLSKTLRKTLDRLHEEHGNKELDNLKAPRIKFRLDEARALIIDSEISG